MEEKYRNAFSEVYCIIENMHPNIRKRININFIKFLEENKNNDYIPDPAKINLQSTENLMKETKIVLAILYDKNLKDN
ncbi:MAG: hypothetical protein IJW20_01595 [Clostridia bacterium]|nr:hypothetical protein [Clostridia bacterium]